jgi:hypothetical protein
LLNEWRQTFFLLSKFLPSSLENLKHRNDTCEKWGLFAREKFLYSMRILYIILLARDR